MNSQQNGANNPAWSPAADAMDMQSMQNSTWWNDPTINEIIQGPHQEPWSTFAGQRQPRTSAQTPWNLLMNYREPNNILSEDGTIPESTPGDPHFHYDHDMVSLTGAAHEAVGATQVQQMLGGIQIGNPGPHMPSMRDNATDAASTFSTNTAGTGFRGPFKCNQCDRICKSQSSLKKHKMTHSRPHLCNIIGCKKKDGFSTPNDLQRHVACVHGAAKVFYRCTHPDCAGVSAPKPWPRKDNFRTHMLKVHKLHITPEVADLEYRVELDPRAESIDPSEDAAPPEDLTSPSMDVPPAGASNHVAESTTLMDVDTSQYQSQQEPSTIVSHPPYFDPFDANSHTASQYPSFQNLGRQADMSFSAESAPSLQGHHTPGFACQSFTTQPVPATDEDIFGPSMVNNPGFQTATQQRPPSQAASAVDNSSVFSVPRGSFTVASSQAPGDSVCHDNLVKDGWTHFQLVAHLGTFPAELLEQALESKKHSSCNSNEPEEIAGFKSRYPCSQCEKVCNRACELKKHMKRHDRPYGCTAKDCDKSFGSKNDWKRHEVTQHPGVEAWACDEDGCIAICEDRFTFMHHLKEAHDMVHSEDLQSRAQNCRIGTKSDARFWCGFCRRVIEVDDVMNRGDSSSSSSSHWNRRFDHIDNHLFGKCGLEEMSKSQWRCLEDEAKGNTERRMSQMSATASVRSTATSNGAPPKRKGSEHVDSRPRKRADGQWAAGSR